jgi:hypothetical protein
VLVGGGGVGVGGNQSVKVWDNFYVCSWGQAVPIGPLDRRMFLTNVRRL